MSVSALVGQIGEVAFATSSQVLAEDILPSAFLSNGTLWPGLSDIGPMLQDVGCHDVEKALGHRLTLPATSNLGVTDVREININVTYFL